MAKKPAPKKAASVKTNKTVKTIALGTGLADMHLANRHSEVGLSDTDLLGMFRVILTARLLDQKIWALNRMGKAAFVVSSQGHEGAHVGTAWSIRAGHDFTLPYYRDLGVMLTLGMSPYEILLAVFARPEDPNSGGRQMPSHWGHKELNVITGSSPIATHIPHASGIAYAEKMRKSDAVTFCYFGDGAASKGDFHEALNFAGIHRLPVVFICENNGYAISVPLSKESAIENIAQHAHSYNFAGVVVDGNDPIDVYAATQGAIRRAQKGEGPTLIECKTYRYLAHTSDDDDRTYRSSQEVEMWRKKDPLQRLKQYLIEQRLLSEQEEEELEASVREEIDEAAKKAEAAAEATAEMAFTKVYAKPLAPIFGAPDGTGDPVAKPTPEYAADSGEERTIVDTVRETQLQLLRADERVLLLGEDVGPRGGVFRASDGLSAEFGEDRIVDTPLAESSIIGIGIGLAVAGFRPITEIQFADFIHSGFDQIVSEAAKMYYRSNGAFNCPLVIRTPWGGGVHGALYHSQSIEAFYSHVAGLKVVAPSTPADVAGMLREALDDPDPVLFLEHKKTYRAIKGLVPVGDWRVPLGKAAIVRPGNDVSIFTYGLHRHLAVEAAEVLAGEGISVEVVDLRTISPLDHETILNSVKRTGRALIVHEDNLSFGVGAEVAALISEYAFYDLDAPVRRLAMPDVPAMPFAAPMEHAVQIEAADIANAVRLMSAE